MFLAWKDVGAWITVVPQALPVFSPLSKVILEGPIWVRTSDGNLYPAPTSSGAGISWGYGGTGPMTLAALIQRLLENPTARGIHYQGQPAPGLCALLAEPWPSGTILTRDQLEQAFENEGNTGWSGETALKGSCLRQVQHFFRRVLLRCGFFIIFSKRTRK